MNVEGSVYKDLKTTAEEIKQDFEDAGKPFMDNLNKPAGTPPPADPKG